jgi:ribonuclease J
VFPEQVAAEPGRYVVLGGMGGVNDLLHAGTVDGGAVMWSMWPGYLREPSGDRFLASVRAHAVPFTVDHTSGHAPVGDLQRLVDALAPQRVVPIHTEGAAFYGDHFPNVERHNDGDWWPV